MRNKMYLKILKKIIRVFRRIPIAIPYSSVTRQQVLQQRFIADCIAGDKNHHFATVLVKNRPIIM